MTTTAYKSTTYNAKRQPPKLANRPYSGRTWAWAIVPTSLVADLVEEHIPEMNKAATQSFLANKDEGWRDYLATRVSSIRRGKLEAALRRLHDITHRKSRATHADLADAICLALGLDLDRDTNIPTLPGSFPLAKALIEDRAAIQGVKITDAEADQYALTTQRLSLLILAYPHKAERLVDLAPFDCLRPI